MLLIADLLHWGILWSKFRKVQFYHHFPRLAQSKISSGTEWINSILSKLVELSQFTESELSVDFSHWTSELSNSSTGTYFLSYPKWEYICCFMLWDLFLSNMDVPEAEFPAILEWIFPMEDPTHQWKGLLGLFQSSWGWQQWPGLDSVPPAHALQAQTLPGASPEAGNLLITSAWPRCNQLGNCWCTNHGPFFPGKTAMSAEGTYLHHCWLPWCCVSGTQICEKWMERDWKFTCFFPFHNKEFGRVQ